MTDRIRLLEHAARKVETNRDFIACLVKKYLEFENVTEEEMRSTLQCTKEDYYKLNLCKVPDINSSDFVVRLNSICKYTNSSAIELNRIIKRASTIMKLTEGIVEQRNYLMAARDKQKRGK
jgi:hypothetical protein